MTRHLNAECVLNLRILFRQPGFWIPTVLFPAMLYAFFGANSGGGAWAANAMASFMVYAVLGVGFFQFGVTVAQDRESAFAKWQRTLPGHVAYQWVARISASVVFVTIAVLCVVVVVVALMMTDVRLGARAWMGLGLVCFICAITATLMGIALGSVCSARAAVPMANLVYLPLAYMGGLWVPPIAMPAAINTVSQWTPTRAMGELGWAAVNGAPWDTGYLGLLAVWTVAAVIVVIIA
jgi:ABC-2 type transport system permease protein|tara:strand:+ start:64 stop:774 length:711 start_codon:yes stop_codon:yes gene_type:complete